MNFGGSPMGLPVFTKHIYHWVPSNFFNHSHEDNVELRITRDGCMVESVALRDMEAGEELFQDYR